MGTWEGLKISKGFEVQISARHATRLRGCGGLLKTPYGVPPPHPLELAVVDPLELALVDESGGQFRTFLVDVWSIFEDFWLIFRPRAQFCNFVLYDPGKGTKS